LLCKLVNTIRPRTIDPSKINCKDELKLFEKLENLKQAHNGAQIALNMPLVNIGVEDLMEGKPVLVLAVLWQLINLHLHTQVARTAHSVRLDYLMKDEVDKSTDDEQLRILLRWFNHHLSNAKHTRRVSNLAGDIRDSENYLVLLHQLAPKECSLSPLSETDLVTRATLLLEQAARIGCKKFVGPLDIVQGTSRLNFAFLANLFTKFQRPPTPPPEVIPSPRVPSITDHERFSIAEEKKKIQDEVKAREIQKLQKDIIIAKELLNLPSAEVLQSTIIKEEKETAQIQKETHRLQRQVETLHEQAVESHQATKKAEEEYQKVEQELTKMVVKHENEVIQIKSKLDDGVAKVEKLKKQLDEAVAQSTKLRETSSKLAAEKTVLEEKVVEEHKDTTRLTRIKEKLDNEIATTKKFITKVQTTKTQVEVAITKVEKQIQEINDDIVDINKVILKVDHYTSIAKEDLEQEQERVAVIQKEKTRLVARKSELEEEMYELQDRLQQEEDATQQALREEKEKAKAEYMKFILTADKEIHTVNYKKEEESLANMDILARKDAAHTESVFAKTYSHEQNAELQDITRQLRDANTEMLLMEKRNTKLVGFVTRAQKRNEENISYNQKETDKLNELQRQEKEAKERLTDRQAETEAIEYKKRLLNKQMEQMREHTIEAELEAANAAREARSLKLEIDVMETVPDELNRQRERHKSYKSYNRKFLENKEESKHEKEMSRLERLKDGKELDKDVALTLMKREEERVKSLRKEKDELEATTEKLAEPRKPRIVVSDDDDIDELLAKANAILEDD